ncbi:hypothetical protein FSARC_8053 [Fusarium sarcochroum]|uniref:Uncharacterized protein n=1 Tax=Fusarium sarcochroum TaxID=1208366 RepID=A0A8H4TU50_9HYPO|nr:hypothetical protein FSARC_8053 [Fusarium sarcochroum]
MFGPFELGFDWPSEHSMASVVYSSHSPLALRDMPQPRPNDAPYNLDASIFTFEDAFEDLLAVSQGQPLPDINSRYEQRRLLRSMFPTGGEPGWFWLRRLRSQGLLEESEPAKLMKSAANYNWDQLHQELDRRAHAVWRAALGGQERDDESNHHHHHHQRDEDKDEDEDEEEFNGHNPLLEGPPESLEQRQRRREAETREFQKREAENFDELFSTVQSAFSEAQSSWDSFLKSITEDHSATLKREDKQLQKPASDEKQVVTKDEYVDRFGYLHTKTLVKTLDEDGNEIGSHSHYTVRPAQKDHQSAQDGEQGKNEQGSVLKVDGSIETKTGWFWK